MKSFTKRALIATVLAGAGFAAFAQMNHGGPGMGGMGHHDRMDPAKMQERMDKRAAELKAKLKLTPAQEGAWTTFTAAMKPPAGMLASHQAEREAMAKLSTPERIDKMKSLRASRDAEMDKRAEAVKTFYAVLTPEQKKVFDAEHMRGGPGRGMHERDGERKPRP